MAEEIRIIKGDTKVLQFSALDQDGNYLTGITNYKAAFITELFNKTTDNTPLDIKIDVDSSGHPIILVYLKSTETNPANYEVLHYTLKLYKTGISTVTITGSSGDLIFIDEE